MARAAATAAALLLIFCSAVHIIESIRLRNVGQWREEGVDLFRQKRDTSKEYCCQMPWNNSLTPIYVACGVLNDTEEAGPFGFPFTHSDPRPDFCYARLCQNTTDGSTENSNEESKSEDDHDKCVSEPDEDCQVQCIFQKMGVLQSDGLPKKKDLENIMMLSMNGDERFQSPVKHAVANCMKKLQKELKKHESDTFDNCSLLEILSYCVDYETSKHCPKDARTPLNDEDMCDGE